MALKKPLVITGGQIQQLQAGDTLDATIASQQAITITNGNIGAIVIGSPVYISANDTVDLAQGNASGTKDVIGLVGQASIVAAATGNVITDGILVGTTAQWDTITGQTGGLTAGSKYYLDVLTAGKLTTVAPSNIGEFVIPVGVALSTTDFQIDIDTDILL